MMIIALPNPEATIHDIALGVVLLGVALTAIFIYNTLKRR